MNPSPEKRLALLIDADNASPGIVRGLLAEVSKYGVATVKRIYGDWTTPNLKGWKKVLLDHSIHPIQQFRYTTGKNATDSAMIIDAMDLLYGRTLDAFCLVSSDSDFTRLASRLREGGLTVYGFGERRTPNAFVSACDKFVFVDVLEDPDAGPRGEPSPDSQDSQDLGKDKALVNLLRTAVEARADEEGWAHLSEVGSQISSQKSDFDSRHYGFRKLSSLMRATGHFEARRVESSSGSHAELYVRWKKGRGR